MSDETLERQPPKFCKDCAYYKPSYRGVCAPPETRTKTGEGLHSTPWYYLQ